MEASLVIAQIFNPFPAHITFRVHAVMYGPLVLYQGLFTFKHKVALITVVFNSVDASRVNFQLKFIVKLFVAQSALDEKLLKIVERSS